MPEFISSPIFLIIAAILGILLLIAIVKGGVPSSHLDRHYCRNSHRSRFYNTRGPARVARESPQDGQVTKVAVPCIRGGLASS